MGAREAEKASLFYKRGKLPAGAKRVQRYPFRCQKDVAASVFTAGRGAWYNTSIQQLGERREVGSVRHGANLTG